MHMKLNSVLAAILLAPSFCFCATPTVVPEPPAVPDKPWRPFPQLQEVLWFEDFESDKKLLEKGTLKSGEPNPPNNQSVESVKADGTNAFIVIKLNSTMLKAPAGLDPEKIFLQFQFWSDEPGDMNVKLFHGKGDYSENVRIPKEKVWVPINVKLGDLHVYKKTARPEAADIWTKLEIKVNGKGSRATFYVDDIVMTYVAKPVDVMPRIQVIRKAITEMTRTPAKDGFTFVGHDALKAELKAANAKRKPRSVLVFSPTQTESDEFIKDVEQAATKAKLAGFTFVGATSPDASDTGGLEDERALLSYNLRKTEAETALLVFGPADAHESKARTSHVLRALLARSIATGTLPLVCLSPAPAELSKENKARVDAFNSSLIDVCRILALPYIDPSALKSSTLAAVAAEALKHIDIHLFGRK